MSEEHICGWHCAQTNCKDWKRKHAMYTVKNTEQASLALEIRILEDLGAAWSRFQYLDVYHEDDVIAFRHAIHAAQNIVMARLAYRQIDYPVERRP